MYVKYSSSIVALSLCLSHRFAGQKLALPVSLAALLAACSSAPVQTQPQKLPGTLPTAPVVITVPLKSRPCHL